MCRTLRNLPRHSRSVYHNPKRMTGRNALSQEVKYVKFHKPLPHGPAQWGYLRLHLPQRSRQQRRDCAAPPYSTIARDLKLSQSTIHRACVLCTGRIGENRAQGSREERQRYEADLVQRSAPQNSNCVNAGNGEGSSAFTSSSRITQSTCFAGKQKDCPAPVFDK